MLTEYFTFVDLIIPPLYFVIFYFIARNIRRRNIESDSSFRYYVPGLVLKLIGSISICLVYVYYYQGGDTTAISTIALPFRKRLSKRHSR